MCFCFQRKLPEKGWSDLEIEIFLNQISAMDKNNAGRSCGVGEREGRVVSSTYLYIYNC